MIDKAYSLPQRHRKGLFDKGLQHLKEIQPGKYQADGIVLLDIIDYRHFHHGYLHPSLRALDPH